MDLVTNQLKLPLWQQNMLWSFRLARESLPSWVGFNHQSISLVYQSTKSINNKMSKCHVLDCVDKAVQSTRRNFIEKCWFLVFWCHVLDKEGPGYSFDWPFPVLWLYFTDFAAAGWLIDWLIDRLKPYFHVNIRINPDEQGSSSGKNRAILPLQVQIRRW